MTVEYRTVPGFSAYVVGDDGSVWTRRCQGPSGRTDGPLRKLNPPPTKKKGDTNRSGPYLRSVFINDDGKKVNMTVHKLVAISFLGPVPDGLCVLHKDDNGLNNKLSNLKFGTHKENKEDSKRNGTCPLGETHGMSIIKEKDVRNIVLIAGRDGVTHREIANRFGIRRAQVTAILNGRAWRHVTGLNGSVPRKSGVNTKRKLTDDDVQEIVVLAGRGNITHREIAEKFNVVRCLVTGILNGKARRDATGFDKPPARETGVHTGSIGRKKDVV